MNAWRPYPLVRLVMPFTLGILIEIFIEPSGYQVTFCVISMAILLAMLRLVPLLFRTFGSRWVYGLIVNTFLIMAGFSLTGTHRLSNNPAFFGIHPEGQFLVNIIEPPSINKYGTKAVVDVLYQFENKHWNRVEGKAIIQLKSGRGLTEPVYGDFLLVRGSFFPIRDNSNPHSFNYSQYLRNKGITHRLFAESAYWKITRFDKTHGIKKSALQVRDRLLRVFRENGVTGKEFAVAAALLLGFVDEIDAELRNDYAAVGAMHILSVSGMHVGIIYVFLEFLLGFLNKHKTGRIIKAGLLLVCIWFYALLTGLSPAVLRSAAMLSMPILSKTLNRPSDMFNIIATSLFFILAMDPFLVIDIGFQLSYLAVTGIIVLYKPIYDLYVTSSWLPDKLWSIMAVSLAAQIATLPVTLYTFHQFPNYFLIANIFVVPLSSLIIYTGILLMVIGSVPIIATIVARFFVMLIWLLNNIIHFIEQLPWSTLKGIFISQPVMWLFYLIIFAGFYFFMTRKVYYLFLLLVTLISLNLLLIERNIDRLNTSRIVVFNIPGKAAYLFGYQDKAVVLYNVAAHSGKPVINSYDQVIDADRSAHGIHFTRCFWLNGIRRDLEPARAFVPIVMINRFLSFANKRWYILDRSIPDHLPPFIQADYVILTNNPRVSMNEISQVFGHPEIIIDATNPAYKTKRWLRDAALLKLNCHAVTITGAFEKEF